MVIITNYVQNLIELSDKGKGVRFHFETGKCLLSDSLKRVDKEEIRKYREIIKRAREGQSEPYNAYMFRYFTFKKFFIPKCA